MSYLRIKWIKGNPYLYEQSSYRVGAKVRTKHIRYIGKYVYGHGGGGGQSAFTPPEALTEERRRYVDTEIDRLQLGSKFPYEREILRQYLYHQNYEFTGASRLKNAKGAVSSTEISVTKFELQRNSEPFVWMHEIGHSLESADKMIDPEIEGLRKEFATQIRQAYLKARTGDLEAKEIFIKQFAALIDIRSDSAGGPLTKKPLEERTIYRRLEMAKSGIIPVVAFKNDFRKWVFAEYRLTEKEIFADSVASLILDPKQAFKVHASVGKQYLSKLYVRLYLHLESKYRISLSPTREMK